MGTIGEYKAIAVIYTEMSLQPIHDLVRIVFPDKAASCKEALNDLLKGELTVNFKKVTQTVEQDGRETDRKKIAEAFKPSGESKDCFTASSLVQLKNEHKPRLMSDLVVGDEVLCSVAGTIAPQYTCLLT